MKYETMSFSTLDAACGWMRSVQYESEQRELRISFRVKAKLGMWHVKVQHEEVV